MPNHRNLIAGVLLAGALSGCTGTATAPSASPTSVPKDAKVRAIRFTGRVTTSIGGFKGERRQQDVPLPPTSR